MQNAPQDPRERAIMEKARVVMEAKKQLEVKAQQLAMREAAVAQREQELQSREGYIAQQAQDLQSREGYVAQQAQDLQSREAALAGQVPGTAVDAASLAEFDAKQRELQDREIALASREATLKDEEGKLEAYRSELIGSAQTLVQKEEDTVKKERELAARSIPIDGRERDIQERDRRLAAREEELKRLDDHMKDRAMELQRMSADLAKWKKDLEALANSRSEIERRTVEQAEREKTLSTRDRALGERDLSLRAFEKKLTDGERALEARRADADRTLRSGQQELTKKGEELVALQKQYKERIAALHSEAEKLSSIPHPAMTESYAISDLSTKLEHERGRSRDLEGRLGEEMRRFSEMKRDYDDHRQKVATMEQSLAKAERDLAEYERRENARVNELESSRADLMQKARMLMEQEEDLKRQQAQVRAAPPPPGTPDSAAQEAMDRRAAMLDQQATMIKRMNEEQEQRAAKLREAAQAVSAKERAVQERENALRLAAPPQAPPGLSLAPSTFTMEQAAPAPMPEAPQMTEAAPRLGESEARDELARAESLVHECQQAGVDVSAVTDQLKMSRELLDEGKYEDAVMAARKTTEMARGCRDAAASRTRSEAVESAQKVVAEVKQLGVQVTEAEGLLDKALQALQGAEAELAERYALEARQKAQAAGQSFNQATESMQRLDAGYRQTQGKKPDLDLRDVTNLWTEASAAFDKGDYATAAELARKAESKLKELEGAKAAQKAAAPGPPPQKYRCPSCAKVFQVVPPAFRPFDVGCPHCHTVVRISK